jgi:hypothetical protein
MSIASLLKKGSLRGLATATPATPATDSPDILPSVATVATVAVANASDKAANSDFSDQYARARAFFPIDADRWAWPASSAMTGAEIDTFTARLARFTDMGLGLDAGERLADKLVIRDREQDDRRQCLECLHLHQGDGWRCGNWQRAGVAVRARDAQLPTDLVYQLQRCNGFADAVSMHVSADSL